MQYIKQQNKKKTKKQKKNYKQRSLFYILAFLINCILWNILPFLQSSATIFVIVGVIVIEIIRPIFFKIFMRGERSFTIISTNRVVFPINDLTSGIAAGFGM